MKNQQITFTTILFALGLLALSTIAQAVVPAPDGGYPGFNTAEGQNALFSRTTGVWNTALGAFTLYGDTTGNGNTAVGINGLRNNITGGFNTAVGLNALFKNNGDPTSGQGSNNCAFGASALFNNSTGFNNCAFGSGALYLNATGLYNTAVGTSALLSNTGSNNTAVGSNALNANGEGIQNTAVGSVALANNVTGNFNTAIGSEAMNADISGGTNTAVGATALQRDSSGGANTALGYGAGANVTTGSFNVYIGTDVGGVAGEVGHTYISNIRSTVQPPINGSDYVTIRLSDGLLGHTSSSRRYKDDVKPMGNASDVLYRLNPVTYCYKKDIDPSRTIDYGLVAEEVAKVDPKLAIRDRTGQVEGVRYSAIYNMLLNEFLKEHRKVQDLEKRMAALTAQLNDQATRIDKVNAKAEMRNSTKKVVLNNP